MCILLTLVISTFIITDTSYAQMAHPATPPMGWNSYDAYGFSVTEDEVKANTDYMADNLKEFGWEYIVVDFLWYGKGYTNSNWQTAYDSVFVDGYGRMRPRPDNFPSSVADSSFKSLADYIHSKGLKFGIHLMRGIPRIAVEKKLPIYGTPYTSDEIGVNSNLTPWYQSMYSVDMAKPGAQEYYNSLIKLYASWGVDYLKIDGISANPFSDTEIVGYYNAVNACGREMVISLSPGPAPLSKATFLKQYSNMWRVRGDLWDRWTDIKDIMNICYEWNEYRAPGQWPDADMLPLGNISIRSEATYLPNQVERYTRLTHAEQYTLMTFWIMFRSPLMFGGNLPDNDVFTNSLITNTEVLEILKNTSENKQVLLEGNRKYWTAKDTTSDAIYLAIFNLNSTQKILDVFYNKIGLDGTYSIRDLWNKKDLGIFSGQFQTIIDGHGVVLFKLVKQTISGVTTSELTEPVIFPNPGSSDVTIKFKEQTEGDVNISIYSLSGVNMFSENYENAPSDFNQKIKLGFLKNGQYIVVVSTKDKTSTLKLFKE
jgi:alpha-galactosidase